MDFPQGADALQATEALRLDLLSEIGKRRDTTVVAYLTSTRRGVDYAYGGTGIDDDDTAIIENHVRAARQMGAKNLDLLLLTEGGAAVMPWGLVSMIREYFRSGFFRVIVPSVAYSAGAAICLGADEIVMGPGSVLGPVDFQFVWSNGRVQRWASASDLQGFLDLIAEQGIGKGFVRRKLFDWLSAHADAPSLGSLYRRSRENTRVIRNLLESRRAALSRRQIERVARFMVHDIGLHAQSLRRTEARANGITWISDIEKSGLEPQIERLFSAYAELMRLRTPHARPSSELKNLRQTGDEWDYDVEGRHLSETPVAMVESVHDTNPAYLVYDLRHWNKAPPLVQPERPGTEEPGDDVRSLFAASPSRRSGMPQARFISARSPQLSGRNLLSGSR